MGNDKGLAHQRHGQQRTAQFVSRDGKQSSPHTNDDAVLLGDLIALYLKGDWGYDEGLKVARYYAPNHMTDDQIRRAVLHAARLQGRQLAVSPTSNPTQRRDPNPTQRRDPNSKPATQQQDNRVWLANVFQRVYGAGFNQPGGYKYTVAEEKNDQGNIVRSIRIFRPDDANAPSYVFRAQPDKTWTLYSGDGKELIRNVYYDPKTKRFFVVGVSEDDVLKTLQPQTTQAPQPPQSPSTPPQQVSIPGAVWFQMLDDNTAIAKTIDNKIRVLQKVGEGQWAILREMGYDEFINPSGSGSPSGQTAPNNTNNQEQNMNWLYLMLPLLAIILSRR